MLNLWDKIVEIFVGLWNFISSEPNSTIIAGVVVFVICECLKEVWLNPLQEYKKLKSKVSRELIASAMYYANPITHSDGMAKEYTEASDKMRELASEVTAFAEIVPCVHLGIPNAKNIVEAGKNLIGLSNSFFISNYNVAETHMDQNAALENKVKRLLNIRGISK